MKSDDQPPVPVAWVHPMADHSVCCDLLRALREKNAELEKRIEDLEDQLRAVWEGR